MAPHAEKDGALDESRGADGDTPQHQGKGRGGKSKGKWKSEVTNKERIQRLDQIYSKKKRQVYFVPTPKSVVDAEKSSPGLHVILKVRRIIDEKGLPTGTEIDIKSSLLRDALAEIYKDVEGLQINESPPIISPEHLFHARLGLLDRVKTEESRSTPNKALIDELGVALEFIAQDYASTSATLASLSEHDEIPYNLLWALFPPNANVYTKSNLLREGQIFKLHKTEYGQSPTGGKFFSIDLRFIAHDGEKLGWTPKNFKINQYDGARKVSNLPVMPLDRLAEKDSVRTELTKRGKRYMELVEAPNGTYQEYVGATVTENRNVIVCSEYKKVLSHITGRVMIDTKIFLQQNEYTDLLKPPVEDEVDTLSITDDDFVFFNHCIGGFSFRQKKWCLFAISLLQPIVWNSNAFSKLVMDPHRRNLIHSLVKSHRSGGDTFDDVVTGKGKGLVGLLSGNPGVGKTMTAEVIAEVTKRPLYMISAGEVGTKVWDVESKLEMVLEVTRQWGCVLLIDEADVFLQKRDGLDLQRNAIVSIFLRRLEYFQGVLILTTNRQNTIDSAFDSRIHFRLHYADLSPESRSMIWKNCLENAPKDLSKGEIKDVDLKKLGNLKLNGRQIKNAMACAISIAMQEKAPLTMVGIQDILDMSYREEDLDGGVSF